MSTMWPFNIETYCGMLDVVSKQHKCISYSEIEHHESFVLWRHDCDMSLNRARFMAEVDTRFNVRSTFFIHPHSQFYNILEVSQTQLIREIIDLGHEIGLHFDVTYHLETAKSYDFEKALRMDSNLLVDIAGKEINAFSFHNPTKEHLEYDDASYAGLTNCYSRFIRDTTDYSSDSNGYWRHRPIPEILQDESKTRLQILTHPEWWLETTAMPRDRVLRCVFGRAVNVITKYDNDLNDYPDRENKTPDDSSLSDYERALGLR